MSDEMGCLDSFCYIKGKAKGMHTNGGCRCVRNLVGRDNSAAAFALEKRLAELHNIIDSLQSQLAASEARVEELSESIGALITWLKFDGKHNHDTLFCMAQDLEQAEKLLASTGGSEQ